MKIALQLSGHMRSFEKCAPVQRALIIDPLQADVFISTWSYLGLGKHTDGDTTKILTNSQLNKINAFYSPIKLEVEQLQHGLGEKYRRYLVDKRDPNGVMNNFNKVARANQLRKNHSKNTNSEYDVVIKARPDFMPLDVLPFDLINEAPTSKRLYLPSFGHFDGLTDILAFGNREVMDVYAACNTGLDAIASAGAFRPEALLKRYILSKGIKVSFFDTDFVLERVVGDAFSPKQHSNHIPDEFKPLLRSK